MTNGQTMNWQHALLKPDSVALIGVSDDPQKTSGRPLRFLRQAGFGGQVYPINPRRATVQGEGAFASLADLPEVPDHAFILTGAAQALDSLQDCIALGVPVATILASGFAEAGQDGDENSDRLVRLLQQGRTRLLGPSSIGLANLHNGLTLTANAAFAEPDLPRGGVFVASHSGSLIGAMASRGKRMGLGFAGLVSVGGETDLSIGQICAATLDDPDVTSYLLFLESLRHANDMRAFALAAADRGKPVAAFKLGRSEAAAELAVSHTGALAGADDVADMFLRDCGIARVTSFEGLLEIMPLLRRLPATPRKRVGRVGVVTTTGGGAAMAVDQLALRGVDIVAPSAETRAALTAAGVSAGAGRIVDLTLAGTRYDVMKAALDVLRAAPEFDMVLATVGSSARFNPELAVQPAVDAAAQPGLPLAVFVVPHAPDARRLLARAGVPAFENPETCADAISAALNRVVPRAGVQARNVLSSGQMLSELASYTLLADTGMNVAPHVALDVDAPVPALPFAYPVVAKVLDPFIAHKSDAGGVILKIANAQELASAMQAIASNVAKALPGTQVRQVLVQQMVSGVAEVLLGLRHDPSVGPVVVLAAGGVFTELYRDSTLRLAPVDHQTALEMIADLRISKIIEGFRGGPRGDAVALADAIVAMSHMAEHKDTPVLEGEVNPLLVLPEGHGVCAVDGLFKVAAP
jgi:acetate---CoA ligase (ADP-forming)